MDDSRKLRAEIAALKRDIADLRAITGRVTLHGNLNFGGHRAVRVANAQGPFDALTRKTADGEYAPVDAEYVVGSSNGTLSAERVLQSGTNTTVSKPGAGQIQIDWAAGIDDLSDVDTTTAAPSPNDYLKWDGANWVPVTPAAGVSSMDDLSDADTTTTPPTNNKVLKWNGSNWVPGDPNDATEFSFIITSFPSADFSDGAVVHVGLPTDTWVATSLDFGTIVYQNGPPTSASIAGAQTPTGGTTLSEFPLTLTTPFTSKSTAALVTYPDPTADGWSGGSRKYVFTLTADNGTDTPTDTLTVWFRNKMMYGLSSTAAPSDAQYQALTGQFVTTSYVLSEKTLTLTATPQYIHFIKPSRISGTPVFKVNGFTTAFTTVATAQAYNNGVGATGYTENFDLYRSPLAYDNSSSSSLTFQVS